MLGIDWDEKGAGGLLDSKKKKKVETAAAHLFTRLESNVG